MISFYKDEMGVEMFKDDTYLDEKRFVVERPATAEDAIAHPDEYALLDKLSASDVEGAM